MKKINLKVTVVGGAAPLKILVNLFKDKNLVSEHSSSISFEKDFTGLTDGKYTLFVQGFNPAVNSAYTTLDISGVGINIISPSTLPVKKSGVGYFVQFKFTV